MVRSLEGNTVLRTAAVPSANVDVWFERSLPSSLSACPHLTLNSFVQSGRTVTGESYTGLSCSPSPMEFKAILLGFRGSEFGRLDTAAARSSCCFESAIDIAGVPLQPPR